MLVAVVPPPAAGPACEQRDATNAVIAEAVDMSLRS